MSELTTFHRPLLGGVQVESAVFGTLTGLATRRSDGKRVLVTNLHVMAGSVHTIGRLTGTW